MLKNELSHLFRTQTESSLEVFISETLNLLGIKFILHYRDGMEIYFYIPELNIGIEMTHYLVLKISFKVQRLSPSGE